MLAKGNIGRQMMREELEFFLTPLFSCIKNENIEKFAYPGFLLCEMSRKPERYAWGIYASAESFVPKVYTVSVTYGSPAS